MPSFNQIQDRLSIVDPAAIPIDKFYIANPHAQPDELLYQLNRAGSLNRFPPQFLVRRDDLYPFTAVICITEGRGTMTIGQKEIPFEKEHILLIPPYTSYEYRSDSLSPFSATWAEFCGGDSERFARYLMEHNGQLFSGGCYGQTVEICSSLVAPPQKQRLTWISEKLHKILLLLYDACSNQNPEYEEQKYQILDYIDEHLGENLTLSGISKVFDYSASYFSKLFLQRTGVHFSSYLLRRRIMRARQLLLNTDQSIEKIAQILGFYDSSYFISKFREVEKVSPARYRRMYTSDTADILK